MTNKERLIKTIEDISFGTQDDRNQIIISMERRLDDSFDFVKSLNDNDLYTVVRCMVLVYMKGVNDGLRMIS